MPREARLIDADPAADGTDEFAGISPNGLRRVTVRGLVMSCSIGVHAYEEKRKQRIRLNLALDIVEGTRPPPDRLDQVVCYNDILSAIRQVIDDGHVHLIETLAERVARVALTDARVREVMVEIEKLDVYQDVESVGVTIRRRNRVPVPA
jgi:dihydroneopterin aldolase